MQCEIQTERNIPPLYDMQTMFSWLDKSRAVVLESGLGHRGINNLYFGHRHAIGKLHNTVWFYKVRWSFPSHFPSLLNTLLMFVHILLSLSFQVNCLSITYNDTFSAINMGLELTKRIKIHHYHANFGSKYYQTLELDTGHNSV